MNKDKEAADSSDQPLLPGPSELRKKYKISADKLGNGNFSEVRLAVERSTGKKVAVKIVDKKKPRSNSSTNFFKNLSREIAILQRVHHPNIVCVYDMYNSENHFFFVMEYVEGGELFEQIVKKGSYSERDAKRLVSGIVRGVAYLHSQGIVHRDLKPENLLLSIPEDQDPLLPSQEVVKIADFGLSSFVEAKKDNLKTKCGTPMYVAPEVLTRSRSSHSEEKTGDGYDRQVDMWSIGVVTYVLLCGCAPFFGDSVKDILDNVATGKYDYPSPYWDEVSKGAKSFIDSLLVVDPKKRMTAEKALQHDWIKGESAEEEAPQQLSRNRLKEYVSEMKRTGGRPTGRGHHGVTSAHPKGVVNLALIEAEIMSPRKNFS